MAIHPSHRLLLLALALTFSTSAFALDPAKAITQYVHRSWRTEDGLPQVSAMAITQSADGFIWIGTRNGLARFDGVHFTLFDKSNTPQIRDSEIMSLAADRDGTLWIGTTAGLTSMRNGRFRALTSADGIPAQTIYSLFVSRSGAVWAGGAGVAYEGRAGVFRSHKLPTEGDVFAFGEDDHAVWVAANGGLVRIDGETSSMLTKLDGLPDNNVLSVAFANHELWIGTPQGVARMRNGKITRDVPQPLIHQEVWAILQDRHGSLWFGTRGGLLRLSSRGIEIDTSGRDGLSSNYVDALFEDREGTLWAGTQLDGVSELADSAITTWSATEGIGAATVWTVTGDATGKIYAGTEGGGLVVIANGRVTPIQPAQGLTSKTIVSLAHSSDGTLWAGSYDAGLFVLRDGHWTSISTKDGLPSNMVNAIEPDGAAIWTGTISGVSRLDARGITTYRTSDGLPSNYVQAIHRDRHGRIWVATEKGVAILDGKRFITQIGSHSLPRQESHSFYEDASGTIWIGTHGGLLRVTPAGAIRVYTSADGLAQDDILGIQQDRAGDFWLTCTRGIFRVRKRELEQGRIQPLLFGPADGMKHGECAYGSSPTSFAAPDGSIWFATSHGAARVIPTLAGHSTPPPVVLDQLLVDGKPMAADRATELAPGTEKLEFHYTSPSFIAPQRIVFRYRLEPYDKKWIDAGHERVAYYTHIPPGNYRFRVAAFFEGTTAMRETQLPLVLRPSFAQTGWFRLLIAAAIALAAAGLYFRHVQRIREQYGAVIAERNRIAREFHDTLAQMLVGIGFHLDTAVDGLDDDPERSSTRDALTSARKLARQCLSDTRRALLDLRPDVLERTDLVTALTTIAEETKKASGIDVSITVAGDVRRLEDRVEQHILRIAQEGLTNAVRHSGARSIRMELRFDEPIELSIRDDGSGPRSMIDSGPLRLGFVGMRERAAEIGGRLTVTSGGGGGTVITLLVATSRRARLATRILASR